METKHLVMPDNHMDNLYLSKNPLIKNIHIKRVKNAISFIPKNAKVICDIGCGEGHLLSLINVPGRKLYGIDILPNVVLEARKKVPNATILIGDAEHLQFKDNLFDATVCLDVLEHASNWRAIVNEILRLTKPGGSMILGWPNDENWNLARKFIGKGPVPDHINILTPRIVRQAINRSPKNVKLIPCNLPWQLCLTTQEHFIK